MPRRHEVCILEAITLFRAIREGSRPAAKRLLDSLANREDAVEGLLRMVGIFLRGQR